MRLIYMKAEELDEKFDNGEEDVLEFFDLSNIKQPGLETHQLMLELPQWMLAELDHQAKLLAVPIPSLINFWLADRLNFSSSHTK